MEREAFKFDGTNFIYEVQQRRIPHKQFKSMPTDFILQINHSRRKEFLVGTDNGEFHPADVKQRLTAFKQFFVDSSVFSFSDENSLHRSVSPALSAAGVDRILWETISEAVMLEGRRMVKSNLQIYRLEGDSECSGEFVDTIVVCVITEERFVCYEDVGEC